ncbi:MAG: 4-hydroxythreonine-4-phosphate dehydrogenase PdxA [Deltaproteobacteria bacterium]|nr:4-hydroxythreonine-4-phosphate dehydrogenase PdxA [Deltaproteobacteria bacterium]
MGCPVGIGPEVALKFLASKSWRRHLPVIIGDAGVLQKNAALLGRCADINLWRPGGVWLPDKINVYNVPDFEPDILLNPAHLVWGQANLRTGRAMAGYIKAAVRLIQAGDLAAMTTCPITKSALQTAGYHYPGHTEMLADLCRCPDFAMMMAGSSLKVTLVTIHQSLQTVSRDLNIAKISKLISLSGRSLRDDFGISHPRMAVAGLNPHAGEGGIFGDEEERLIAPAIARSQAAGWQVAGPFPPDTVFNRAVNGDFDLVVCMYHDQGLIPFKLLHFADGVNVTIGLPIVRTSVDHGTAYDIAGQGKASPASLLAAYEMAAQIADNRGRGQKTDGDR